MVVLCNEVLVFLFQFLQLGAGAVLFGFMVFGFRLDLEAFAFESLELFGDFGEFFVGVNVVSFG